MEQKNWIHPNPHELEVKPNKVQNSYLVGWWNYKVVKERVVEWNKRYAPNSTWACKQYIKNQIQYQEANTINNAYEIRTKWKRVLYDAQMQGGMMT